ncbi:MAG TPA: hypothetical protein DCX06_00850 [Opitutae bacterium]|nr:hypothetical protein [Opitutae bacterium]
MKSSLLNKFKLKLKEHSVSCLFAIITPSICIASNNDCFANAYENDSNWPQFVTPSEAIELENGTRLSAFIPLVLSRAYEDGTLVVIDRAGATLIDHSKTNFLELTQDDSTSEREGQNFHNFIQQLGRRVFDLSHSTSKAVPEKVLSEYKSFLVIRCAFSVEHISEVTTELDTITEWLNSNNCRPIIIFKKSVANAQFYEFLETNKVNYPVVVPIFTQGLTEFIYTDRESETPILWINKNGKKLNQASSIQAITEQ